MTNSREKEKLVVNYLVRRKNDDEQEVSLLDKSEHVLQHRESTCIEHINRKRGDI